MEHARRAPAALGIAALGAALIAAAPITPTLLDGAAMPPGIRLTSVFDDLTKPYSDLFTHTWTNLEAIGADRLHDPTPLLDQIFTNQSGYLGDVWAAVQGGNPDGVFASLDAAARGIAEQFLTGYAALTDWSLNLDTSDLLAGVGLPGVGDIAGGILGGSDAMHDLIQGMLNQVGDIHLNMGIPLALTVDALGGPLFGLLQTISSGSQFFDAIGAGDWSQAFTTAFTAPALISDAYLNTDGISLGELLSSLNGLGLNIGSLDDLLGGLNTDLGTLDLTIKASDLGAPSWANFLSTTAHVNLGDLSGLNVDGQLPLGGLLAQLGHASADGSIDWSGLNATFEPLKVWPLSWTPSPINISGGTFDIGTTVDGTPTGGLIPGLFWAEHQLADALSGQTTMDWTQLGTFAEELFAPDRFAGQIHDILTQFGLGAVDTSWLDPTNWLDLSWLDATLLQPLFDGSWLDGLLP